MSIVAGLQSAFHPQSPDAAAIAGLMWVLIAGAATVFVLVMVLTLLALRRRPAWLARHRVVVVGGIAFPAVVVCLLLVYSLRVAAALDHGPADLRVHVIGHQWWWEVRYLDADGRVDFETANELRLPVGRSVEIALTSDDVLHSFWVPSLAGKLDLVPGRTNRMFLRADRAGVFRGQCAEYCGGPHAQMALYVVAAPEDAFERWRAGQRTPAAAGDEVFLARCAACHTVRGTPAHGTLGPDLTHVGSRLSLGAGILPNDPATLARWIGSNQHIKPGNLMPAYAELGTETVLALAVYLHGLQ